MTSTNPSNNSNEKEISLEVLPEFLMEFSVYTPNLQQDIPKWQKEFIDSLSELCEGYIWQFDTYNIVKVDISLPSPIMIDHDSKEDARSSSPSSLANNSTTCVEILQGSLQCCSKFIKDKWFLTGALDKTSTLFPEMLVRVWDQQEGDFVIKTLVHHGLSRKENALELSALQDRYFIRNGCLLWILADPDDKDVKSISWSIRQKSKGNKATATGAFRSTQRKISEVLQFSLDFVAEVFRRFEVVGLDDLNNVTFQKYAALETWEKIYVLMMQQAFNDVKQEQRHSSCCYLPEELSILLKYQPQWISKALHSLNQLNQDHMSFLHLAKLKRFNPENDILQSASSTASWIEKQNNKQISGSENECDNGGKADSRPLEDAFGFKLSKVMFSRDLFEFLFLEGFNQSTSMLPREYNWKISESKTKAEYFAKLFGYRIISGFELLYEKESNALEKAIRDSMKLHQQQQQGATKNGILWSPKELVDDDWNWMTRNEKSKSYEFFKAIAKKYFDSKGYHQALCLYNGALQWYPFDATLLCNRALVFIKMRLYIDALKDIETVLYHHETHLKGLFLKGKILISLKRYAEAIQCLSKCPPDSSGLVEREISIAKGCIEEQNTGIYDFSAMKKEEMASVDHRIEHGDYISGAVAVEYISKERGLGIICKQDVPMPGTLLCACKAIEVIFPMHDTTPPFVGDAMKTARIFKREPYNSKTCLVDFLCQRLYRDTGLLKELSKLYSGMFFHSLVDRLKNFTDPVNPEIVYEIVERNNFRLGELDSATGLWFFPSFLNHNCIPNARYYYIGDFLLLRNLTPLKKGQEVCISYFSDIAVRTKREETLKEYGISCHCHLCENDRRDLQVRTKLSSELDSILPLMMIFGNSNKANNKRVRAIISTLMKMNHPLDTITARRLLLKTQVESHCFGLNSSKHQTKPDILIHEWLEIRDILVNTGIFDDMILKVDYNVAKLYKKLNMKEKEEEYLQKLHKNFLASFGNLDDIDEMVEKISL